jgi:hypothetical protein
VLRGLGFAVNLDLLEIPANWLKRLSGMKGTLRSLSSSGGPGAARGIPPPSTNQAHETRGEPASRPGGKESCPRRLRELRRDAANPSRESAGTPSAASLRTLPGSSAAFPVLPSPFLDPDLPQELLPENWLRPQAAALFDEYHDSLTEKANEYFDSVSKSYEAQGGLAEGSKGTDKRPYRGGNPPSGSPLGTRAKRAPTRVDRVSY